MPRYLVEVAYDGSNYAGFQKQHNANTIQDEVEKALKVYFRTVFQLTGSSRTDAGVHARQNFFHFDHVELDEQGFEKALYHINAILPADIVVQSLIATQDDFHCRFHATARSYRYKVYQKKNPFRVNDAFYYPYKVDLSILQAYAAELYQHTDFESFAKRNSQVHTFNCSIHSATWTQEDDLFIFTVKANRFLRGMVRGLVGTMLHCAAKKMAVASFREIIEKRDCSLANFNVPPHALTLLQVHF